MVILSDHETMAQFTLGLVGISLLFSGTLWITEKIIIQAKSRIGIQEQISKTQCLNR
jgi:hypothetical protein